MIGALITMAVAVTFFIPTPYYVYSPGSAEQLAPKVTVAGGEKDEQGNLMLTTVLSMPASNIYYLAYGWLLPHSEIREEQEVKGDLSNEEYERLLQHMMATSQQSAIINAYRAANESYQVHYEGVFVASMESTSKAKGILEIGDIIHTLDGQTVKNADDLRQYMNASKQPGDKVKVGFKRDGLSKTAELEVVRLEQTGRVGIGFGAESHVRLDTERKVEIHAEDIGGPSAGLMFSLEIFSQLTPGDLTKGYRIAGTGTLDMDGNVGQIGGIRHKIVAADEEGADFFFVPADLDDKAHNAADAADEAAQIGTKMKVVPVKTMQEAIDYLQKLPAKQ